MNCKHNAMYAALSFSLLTLTACGGGGDSDGSDVQAPNISLNGESPMLVAHGTVFSDPGASVTDNVDTNLSVIASGSVDTNTLGSYKLTYSATDSAGNSAQISRVVNVADQTAPEIVLIGEAEVSVEQNGSFTDLGSKATDNIDENLVVTVSGSVDLSEVGSYVLTYDVSDAAGNAATSVERTVVVSPITGRLSDMLISGLAYVTATQSGVTDEEGKYLYQAGEDIQFSLGTTPIGDAVNAHKSMALTDLLPSTVLYTTYGQLRNLDTLIDNHADKVAFFRLNNTLSLLQSVDDDSNPDNGINIPEGVLKMFTGEAINLEQHFYYLAGKGRRYGDGDQMLKHILQPAHAQGLLDSGDIISYGIALDDYYRLNNIPHQLDIRTETHTDSNADGIAETVLKEVYSELGDRVRKEKDIDNNGEVDEIYVYTFDSKGRYLNYSVDANADGNIDRMSYRRYDVNGNYTVYESDDDADGNIDARATNEFDSFGNEIASNYDDNADGTLDEISTYTYDDKGNQLTYSYDQDGDGQPDNITENTFDSRGNRLTSTGYSGDRAVMTSHHEYHYDERNNMTSTRYDWHGDGHVDYSENTTYDLNNKPLVSERDQDGNGSIDWRYSYSYDVNGYSELTIFEEIGVETGIYHYIYDSLGNRLSQKGDNDGDGTIDYSYINTFDLEGNELTEVDDYDNDGNPDRVYHYTYNSLGNKLSESRDTNGDGVVDEITTYTLSPANFRAVLYDLF